MARSQQRLQRGAELHTDRAGGLSRMGRSVSAGMALALRPLRPLQVCALLVTTTGGV